MPIFCEKCDNSATKILTGCRHYLCLLCIQTSLSKSSSFVTCPVCQVVNYLGLNGPEGLEDAVEKVVQEAWNDQFGCLHIFKVKTTPSCSHCGLKFCKECENTHKLELISAATMLLNGPDIQSWGRKLAGDIKTQIASVSKKMIAAIEQKQENLCKEVDLIVESRGGDLKEELMAPVCSRLKGLIDRARTMESAALCLKDVQREMKAFEARIAHRLSKETCSIDIDNVFPELPLLECSEMPKLCLRWNFNDEISQSTDISLRKNSVLQETLAKLHEAIWRGSLTQVERLLEPACRWQPEVLKALLTAPIRSNFKDPKLNGLLANETFNSLLLACCVGHVDLVTYIVEKHNASVDAVSFPGNFNGIHLAACFGRLELLNVLLKLDPSNCLALTVHGYNALHLATFTDRSLIIDYLLRRKVLDVNSLDFYGFNPIHYAFLEGSFESLRILLYHGGIPLSSDVLTVSPLVQYAIQFRSNIAQLKNQIRMSIENDDINLLKSLAVTIATLSDSLRKEVVEAQCVSLDVEPTALLYACRKKLDQHVKLLIEVFHADPFAVLNNCKMNALQTAAMVGSLPIFEYLVRADSKLLSSRDSAGNSVLHNAISRNQSAEIVSYILERKLVKIEDTNHEGNTPLLYAAIKGSNFSVKVLLNYGANLHATNNRGQMAIHAAIVHRNLGVVKVLVKHDKKLIQAVQENNESALTLARLMGRKEIVDYFENILRSETPSNLE